MRLSKELAETLIRVSKYATTSDQTRFHLTNVRMKKVDDTRIEVAATDGHLMVYITIEDKALASTLLNSPYYLSQDDAEVLALKIKQAGPHKPFVDFLDIKAESEIDFKYPNIDSFKIDREAVYTENFKVVKGDLEVNRKYSIGIDANLLIRIAKCFENKKALRTKLTFDTRENIKPILVTGQDNEMAILMPMRV